MVENRHPSTSAATFSGRHSFEASLKKYSALNRICSIATTSRAGDRRMIAAASDFDLERTSRKASVKSGALHLCETNLREEVHLESTDHEALAAALGFHG
jgi:hypothetical protein